MNHPPFNTCAVVATPCPCKREQSQRRYYLAARFRVASRERETMKQFTSDTANVTHAQMSCYFNQPKKTRHTTIPSFSRQGVLSEWGPARFLRGERANLLTYNTSNLHPEPVTQGCKSHPPTLNPFFNLTF